MRRALNMNKENFKNSEHRSVAELILENDFLKDENERLRFQMEFNDEYLVAYDKLLRGALINLPVYVVTMGDELDTHVKAVYSDEATAWDYVEDVYYELIGLLGGVDEIKTIQIRNRKVVITTNTGVVRFQIHTSYLNSYE